MYYLHVCLMHHNRHYSVNQILETTNHSSDEFPAGYRHVLTQNALVPTQPFLFHVSLESTRTSIIDHLPVFPTHSFLFFNPKKPKYTMPSFSDHTLGSGISVKSWMQIWPCRNMYEWVYNTSIRILCLESAKAYTLSFSLYMEWMNK